jgi:hypothetical protein
VISGEPDHDSPQLMREPSLPTSERLTYPPMSHSASRGPGPGAAADQAGLRDQAALGSGSPTVLQDHQPSQDEELHHAEPRPGGDDQPVPEDQQPGNITCKVTQPATTPAAVVRLVINPVGYHINVPHSHLATQVQPSQSPRPEPEDHHQEDEMAKTHLEDRKSYVHKRTCQEVEKDKTNFGDVLMPDDKDQQTPHGRLTTPDSTHLKAGEHETYHVAGYNAMHVEVDTKYEITFKKAVQKTAPLDAIFPTMRIDPDSMTQQQTHNKRSEAYEVACQMDATIKTYLKEMKNADTESVDADLDNPQKNYVTDRRGTTDNAEMLADSTTSRACTRPTNRRTRPTRRRLLRLELSPMMAHRTTACQAGRGPRTLPGGPLCPMLPQRRGSPTCRRACAK